MVTTLHQTLSLMLVDKNGRYRVRKGRTRRKDPKEKVTKLFRAVEKFCHRMNQCGRVADHE